MLTKHMIIYHHKFWFDKIWIISGYEIYLVCLIKLILVIIL